MTAIKIISCDVHGTLVLPTPSVGAIYASYAQAHHYEADAADLEAAFLPAFKRVRDRWGVAYGGTQNDAHDFWVSVIKETFQTACSYQLSPACCEEIFQGFGRGVHWRVLHDVVPVLQYLNEQGLPLCICSNFDDRARVILKDHQLDHYFDDWFISAEIGIAKPDPEFMQCIADHYKCTTQEIVHIGNHLTEDAEMCRASGAQFFHVDERQGRPLQLEQIKMFLNSNEIQGD